VPETKFGDELRRLRRQANLTLADLADAIGTSIVYISDVERGRKNPPSPIKLKKLLAAMRQEALFPQMLALAVKSRRSVEISVENKSDEVTDMVVALARRCDEGDLTNDTIQRILRLLEKEEKE
jgi:transcriptional regulator with XRE-family HTH domain